jgi:hypothetical protein
MDTHLECIEYKLIHICFVKHDPLSQATANKREDLTAKAIFTYILIGYIVPKLLRALGAQIIRLA